MLNLKANNLVAITAGAKGVGKTWFSYTLSQALSGLKKKNLFFDADGGVENISAQLGLSHLEAYSEMLKGFISLNNAVRFFPKGRFDIISSRPGEEMLATYPTGRAQILALDLKNFSTLYDHVFIDCSNDFPVLKNVFLNAATQIILLIKPSLTGAEAAYKELEHIYKINPMAKVFVVVNQALSSAEGKAIFKTLETADEKYIGMKPKFLGVIRQDGRIRESILNKMTLFERYNPSETLNDVLKIAKAFQEEENGL